MTTRQFGERVARVEDDRLLRGLGQYTDDLVPGALQVAVVRSPHAHARITAIEVDAVLDVEGVVAVYTYDDLTAAMAEPLPLLIPHPALTHGRTQYALARDEVNYVGEAIAMVVATDRYVAEDAAARIRVSYQALPAVVGAEGASQVIHPELDAAEREGLQRSVATLAQAIASASEAG